MSKKFSLCANRYVERGFAHNPSSKKSQGFFTSIGNAIAFLRRFCYYEERKILPQLWMLNKIMNCAITSQFCHLNLLVEKRRKNRGLRLFSAEGNKRGIKDNGQIKSVLNLMRWWLNISVKKHVNTLSNLFVVWYFNNSVRVNLFSYAFNYLVESSKLKQFWEHEDTQNF